MYTVSQLYYFFKIIESTNIKFIDESDLANKLDIPTILRLLNAFDTNNIHSIEKHKKERINYLEQAKIKIKSVMKYYSEQSQVIEPLNIKLNDFAELEKKEFERDFTKKRDTRYNTYIKEDDPLNFEVEINTASKILLGLRQIITALHAISKGGLENTLDMLDATKTINEHARQTIISDMIQYLEETLPNNG